VRDVARSIPGLSRAYWGTRRELLLRRGHAPVDFRDVRLRVTTREIVEKRLHPRAKEPWTVEWLERSVRDGDVVYDIGANVGAYALIAARLADARVVAFEPASANYEALCGNVVLNGLGERIVPLPVVLAESTRLAELGSADMAAGATHSLAADGASGYRQPVLAFALDELIASFALPQPTLVKLDVDGAEAAVLDGARGTLARPELRSVLVEVDDAQTDAVRERIEAAGFGLAARFDERDGEPLPGIWYGVFERGV
jgi:FkbM family methyltransferase